ncbi:TetR/AcrR family transcriptional regulator [Acidobacteriota bacterium]
MGIMERREREKEQRRNDIIDAAEKVFFHEGLDEATMDDVAETAELSKGTLYLYFESKEDLYLAITKRGLDILADIFQEAVGSNKRGIDKIKAIGRTYSVFAKKYPDYFQAIIYHESRTKDSNEECANALACEQQGEKVLRICVDALRVGLEDGSIRSDIDPMKAAIVLWGQTTGILLLISRKGEHLKELLVQFNFKSLDEIIDESFKLIGYALESKK